MKILKHYLPIILLIVPGLALADLNLPAVSVVTDASGKETYTLSIQVLLAMTAFSILPALLLLMTSFTRIIVVLAILRQAIGMPQTPTNQILIGLALFLSLFVMMPVFEKAYNAGVEPYMSEKISGETALEVSKKPFREFMLAQTRINDITMFANIAGIDNVSKQQDYSDVPFSVLIPAFVTSELKTAFQMGFMLFIPFLIVDLVVASVLMSMGMMMLSPLIISLPFKIMLFVLVDGWSLVMGTLATSFGIT